MLEFVFILVEPADDRNIGAAARAMNTMGHHDLRLVRPSGDPLSGKAKALGHGSQEILESAQIYSTLDQALEGLDLACASTARHRQEKYDYLSVRDLPHHLHNMGSSLQRVGLVFGSENSGLNNRDLERCDLITTIPQHTLQPSLNLSQAVMVYAYVCAEAQTQVLIEDQRLNQDEMPPLQYANLKASIQSLMARLDLTDRTINYVLKALAKLSYEDLYLVHNLRSSIARALERLESSN